jgi:hypothetical protein
MTELAPATPELETPAAPPVPALPRWKLVVAAALAGSSSWLLSLALHLAVVLGLAMWHFPELPQLAVNLLTMSDSPADEVEEIEELSFSELELDQPEPDEPQPDTSQLADEVSFSEFADVTEAPSLVELSETGPATAPMSMPTDGLGFAGMGTSGRGQMARTELVRRGGGNGRSEEAVARCLQWLAQHQNPDGTWSLIHDGGKCQGRCDHPAAIPASRDPFSESLRSGTGLALLPFLGAGQTHEEGKYQKVVLKGLQALERLGKREPKGGFSWMDSGNMYAHGLNSIVLTEAFGMTQDSRLIGPAQSALDFIVYAQDPRGGGWRYSPRQAGDTSVVGWQVMALKSGHLAGLNVPASTVKGASAFLDTAAVDDGFTYDPNRPPINYRLSTSAVGLLCRMYLGWQREDERLKRGVEKLAAAGPSEKDYYYNYYAAQVLFQYTGGEGPMWKAWNEKLRDQLIAAQDKQGHARGSWYVDDTHAARGGRLYVTSLAAMTLEVYYRYMPIYQTDAVVKEFPE